MKAAGVIFYVLLAVFNFGQAVAAGFFGWVPDDSAVAFAAFLGAAGVFMQFANDAVQS